MPDLGNGIEHNAAGFGLPIVARDMVDPVSHDFLHGHVLQGDEEAIEACSDQLYEVIQPHFNANTGEIDTKGIQTDENCIQLVGNLSRTYGQEALVLGLHDATRTLRLASGIIQ